MFATRDDEFIVEPLWNETNTTTTIGDNDAAAAAAAGGGLYHIIYRRSAVKTASAHRDHHCGLSGLYSVNLLPRVHGYRN